MPVNNDALDNQLMNILFDSGWDTPLHPEDDELPEVITQLKFAVRKSLITELLSEMPENPYSESPIPEDPVYTRMYLDKWYGFDDAAEKFRDLIKRKLDVKALQDRGREK